MAISSIKHGPVWINRGRYAGQVGYYDDDTDDRAIVYLGVPFESKFCKLHYSEFESIENVTSLELEAFKAKNPDLIKRLRNFR